MSKNEVTNKNDYKFTDCKPVGDLSYSDIQALEHKYRLLLKESGFQDVEKWDNRPKDKVKKVQFIKGHIRVGNHSHSIGSFYYKGWCKKDYVRIIALYAYHCPKVSSKYKDVLQDYSLTGNLSQSIRNTNSPYKIDTIQKYVHYNIGKMIKFVNEEFGDE